MPMKKIVFILSLVYCQNLTGQKISGVYQGELITPNNAFTISAKDTIVIGSVYLNPYDKLSFWGSFNNGLLQGDIVRSNGDNYFLIGQFVKDSLFVKVISYKDTSQVKFSWLARVSTNLKYDLNKLFGKNAPQYDANLIGTWAYVKTLDENGVDITKENVKSENMEIEYKPGGQFTISMNMLKKMNPSGSEFMPSSRSWETKGDKLITTTVVPPLPVSLVTSLPFAMPLPPSGPVQSISLYEIRKDTLITTSKQRTRDFYARKK